MDHSLLDQATMCSQHHITYPHSHPHPHPTPKSHQLGQLDAKQGIPEEADNTAFVLPTKTADTS